MKHRNGNGWLFALVGLLLVGGVMLGYRQYASEMRARRAQIDALMPQVAQTPFGPMEYVLAGSGDAVLVIHGNGGGVDQGMLVGQGYFGEGYRLIAPSRFGYLGSPLPKDASVAMQADAFASLLDALGVERVTVFATSAGVTSAAQFALRYPERVTALILHSPNSPGEVGLAAPPRAAFSALLRSDFAYWTLVHYLGSQMQFLVGVPKGFTLTPELQAEVENAMKGVLPVSRRVDGMVFDTYTGNPVINTIDLEQIQVPTLVLSAVDDPMTLHESARRLAARIPGAQFVPIPDGGHMMLGHTTEVREHITAFLRARAVLPVIRGEQ